MKHTRHAMTHHPRVPDLPLRAGHALHAGDVCWIDEDGRVYRTDARRPRGGPVDGFALDATAPGALVTLYPYARVTASISAGPYTPSAKQTLDKP
jgi:hypothetical protein